jgi:hypothetical protein
VGDHFNIKAGLLKQNIQVVSVTEPIDANPEGRLLETILAGFAQFNNDLRAARTLQGMRRKIQEGLFPWKPPLGYRTVTQPGTKKTRPDVPDQPLFRLLQRAWQEFATGAYTKTEVLRLMNSWGVRTRHGVPLSKQSLDDMFRDPFYAGIIRDPWADREYPGRHIPLVSREVFAKVQGVIRRRARSVRHERVQPELPLRMFARCPSCEHYVSGGLSRGRSRYYPYYRCFNKACGSPANYRTSIVHDEFVTFLASISPDRTRIVRVVDAVTAAARNRVEVDRGLSERRTLELRRLEQQGEQLIQMRMENLLTTEEFMTQKTRITTRRQDLEAEGEGNPTNEREMGDLIDEICDPIAKLGETWLDIPPPVKQRFQQSVLPKGFVAGRIGTAKMSSLFSTFYGFQDVESTLVHPDSQFWNQIVREMEEFARIIRLAHDKTVGV